MNTKNDQFDTIIVGNGGGSIPAALVIKDRRMRPLIIEKQSIVGGTSAFSSGVIWILNNQLISDEGGDDSHDKTRTFLDRSIGAVGPPSSTQRLDTHLRKDAEMVSFLDCQGMKFLRSHWSNYYYVTR